MGLRVFPLREMIRQTGVSNGVEAVNGSHWKQRALLNTLVVKMTPEVMKGSQEERGEEETRR